MAVHEADEEDDAREAGGTGEIERKRETESLRDGGGEKGDERRTQRRTAK